MRGSSWLLLQRREVPAWAPQTPTNVRCRTLRRIAVLLASIALLAGTTACSGGAPAAVVNTPKPTEAAVTALNASEVVSGLTAAGYKCGADGTYAICTAGPVAVWVLTGAHPRPPIVSLHAPGAAEVATAAIAKELPKALEIAHIAQRSQIIEWFGQQAGKTTAQLTAGDWQVDWSAEVDSEEPGAHLSLADKLCTANCQAE